MKIRWTAGETSQNRSLQSFDVFPQSADESAPRIGGPFDFAGRFVQQSEDRQIAQIERAIQVADPDVQWCGNRVVTDIRGIVASPACTRNRGEIQVVVETGNASDVDRLGIEQGLPADDSCAAEMLVV